MIPRLWQLTKRFGPYALVLGLLTAVLLRPRSEPAVDESPEYAVTVVDPTSGEPAPDPSRLRVVRGGRFALSLRPTTPSATKVIAYAFAWTGEVAEPIDVRVEVAPNGTVRVSGSSRVLEAAGARELRVVVGAAAAFHRFDDAVARAASGRSDAVVRVLSVALDR